MCKKEKRNSQGKDPSTFDGNLSTPKTNSQGLDPRTFKEPVEKVASSEEAEGKEVEEKEKE